MDSICCRACPWACLISKFPYQMGEMCLAQARRTLTFYLRAEVKGVQLNSLGLESAWHLERAFFPLFDMVFISTLAPKQSQAVGPSQCGGKTNSEPESLSHLC